ncbi:hypothetical protein [Nocardia acidivorans]|uniref:hypothetical protein n=1 Tax=Nocardia acidivorans TaxID=404580 RepID=UPI000A508094|nr:hypothetical protein [Nocardia acidivorans]
MTEALPAGGVATPTATFDVIDEVLGAHAELVRGIRRQRPEVVLHSQEVYAALLDGPATASVGRERLIAAAVAVAELAGAPTLAAHYAGLGTIPAQGDPVLAAILRHAALVSTAPATATRADIDALSAAGLSERDIVTVAQLIGFVHFQVRLLAGLSLTGAEHE